MSKDEAQRGDLVELIKTVMVYKLAQWTREEIEAMLQVSDLRETRVYRDAKAEGVEEERKRQIEERKRQIARMAAENVSAADIARYLGLDLDLVRNEIDSAKAAAKNGNGTGLAT